MAKPALGPLGARAARLALTAFCALVLLFLIAPLLVIVPLSFNAEPYFTFTQGMLQLDPEIAAKYPPILNDCLPQLLSGASGVPVTDSIPPSADATRSLTCQFAQGPWRPNGVRETCTRRVLFAFRSV